MKTLDTNDRDLEFIRNPDLWTQWPYLPLKRRTATTTETAVAFEGGDRKYKIAVGANLFAIGAIKHSDWKTTTPDQIIHEGWVVD